MPCPGLLKERVEQRSRVFEVPYEQTNHERRHGKVLATLHENLDDPGRRKPHREELVAEALEGLQRTSDADEEVLEVAHDVVRFAGAVRLLTADTGVRVGARSEGPDVLFVPKEWRRTTGDVGPPQAAPESE